MSTYKEIFGKTIKHLSSDPDNSTYEGQIWYNTTAGKFKTVVAVGAWSSSSPLIVARDGAGSAGTQTTATIFGGNINPGNTSATDEYNGSGFSSGGTLNTARRQTTGCGLQTAALCVGGYTTANAANVEEYNGTSWSEQNDIPSNSRNGSTFGTQTAALYVGGYTVPVPNSDVIQIYDGTNWTISPATLGTGGNAISSTGTSTAGLVFGGSNRLNLTEEWNGTAMSTGGTMTTSKYDRGSANQAPSENAMSAGGGIPAQTTVENYDGTTWSTLPSLAVATNSIKGAGTASAAMMMGGGPGGGPVFNTTTEFNFSANTITAAAWSSGGTMVNATRGGGSMGTDTAAVAAGGILGSPAPAGAGGSRPGQSEEYNGTTWSNLPTIGRSPSDSAFICGGTGTATAGLINGGMPGGSGQVANTDEWDGSSWTSSNTMNTARQQLTDLGTQTAAFATGGTLDPGPNQTAVESYDGTSWTNGTGITNARKGHGAGGSTSSGWVAAGEGPSARINDTEEWNGTSWTAGGDTLNSVSSLPGAASGPQTNAIIAGGALPSATNFVQNYNGTSWATLPSLSTSRYNAFGTPAQTSNNQVMVSGGFDTSPNNLNSTEHFTAETTSINIESVDNS